MRYFTIRRYETIKLFLDRVKHDIGHIDFYAQSISKEFAAGDKVVQVVNKRDAFDIIKFDGPSKEMEEVYELLRIKVDMVKKHAGEKPINNPELFKRTELDDIDGLKDLE